MEAGELRLLSAPPRLSDTSGRPAPPHGPPAYRPRLDRPRRVTAGSGRRWAAQGGVGGVCARER